MRKSKIAVIAAAAFAASAAGAAPASADTTVMGSPLVAADEQGVSGGASTVSVQLSFDPGTSTNPVQSPANGIITGWKVKSTDDGAIYSLKVMRANGLVSLATATNTNFTSVAAVQAPAAVPAGTAVASPQGAIFSYPASLPIREGDFIGILTGGADDGLPQKTTNGIASNLIGNNFSAQPFDGLSANLLADQQHELLLQATVQYCKVPELKGKKAKAAKAALTAADCVSGKVVRKPVGKKKLLGKVLKTKPAAGETGVPGTAVKVTVGVKKKK